MLVDQRSTINDRRRSGGGTWQYWRTRCRSPTSEMCRRLRWRPGTLPGCRYPHVPGSNLVAASQIICRGEIRHSTVACVLFLVLTEKNSEAEVDSYRLSEVVKW
jgi:hypothetical protein